MAIGWSETAARRGVRAARLLAVLLAGLAGSSAAWAGSMSLFGGDLQYKLTLNYGLAVRAKDPDPGLIDGPVDPLQSHVNENGQLVGFGRTGLPMTINTDDGNRNFRAGDLINNRLSAFSELLFTFGDYGALFNGSGFYDFVFHESNANDSPETINKLEGPNDEFHPQAKIVSGEKIRLLEAYVYGNWYIGSTSLNLRVGQHLAAWGESLFFPGITAAQGPFDATKAFVPGAEIKEILLPVPQASFQWALTNWATWLGFYQFKYEPTDVFPVGDYFSPADVVGPGAEFAYGSINPAFADGCPGLFPAPLDQLCNTGGLGGPLLNADPNILVPRGPDITPEDDTQWGTGLKFQVTDITDLSFYYLNYHNHNPALQFNIGCARAGTVGDHFTGTGFVPGQDITTCDFDQRVPVEYQIKYFDDITMAAVSFSTRALGLNVGGEFIYRDGIDTSVQAIISDVNTPIATRAETHQLNLSALYVGNPDFLVYDEFVLVGEAAYMRVKDVVPIEGEPGVQPVGNGDELYYDKGASAIQLLSLLKGRNVIPGWDFGTQLTFAWLIKGTPSVAGTFGSLFGDGDTRFSVGASMQYLQNLEFSVGYNFFFGDPNKAARGLVKLNPYMDRDYATFNIKYNL